MLSDKVVVFSGFRDAALADKITKAGGVVKTSLVKATNLVVYKQDGKAGTKIDDAKERGIEVMELEKFKRAFFGSKGSPKAAAPAPAKKAAAKKATTTTANNQCNYIALPKFQADFEKNGYKPTLTVKQVEELVQQILKTGDIVNFGPVREFYSQVVGSNKHWVRAASPSDNLYIPLSITSYLSDALKFYAKQIKNEGIDYIELPKTDATIVKIFAKPSSFDLDKAQFTYLTFSKSLEIKYKGATQTVSAPLTLKKIEKAFETTEPSEFAKISAEVVLFVDDKEHTIPIEIRSATLKKIFGTKVTFASGLAKSVRVKGVFDIEKIKEKVNGLAL